MTYTKNQHHRYSQTQDFDDLPCLEIIDTNSISHNSFNFDAETAELRLKDEDLKDTKVYALGNAKHYH